MYQFIFILLLIFLSHQSYGYLPVRSYQQIKKLSYKTEQSVLIADKLSATDNEVEDSYTHSGNNIVSSNSTSEYYKHLASVILSAYSPSLKKTRILVLHLDLPPPNFCCI
jgi:hypothetical protein